MGALHFDGSLKCTSSVDVLKVIRGAHVGVTEVSLGIGGITRGTVSAATFVGFIFGAYGSWPLSLCHTSPQKPSADPKNDLVVLSDRSQVLFKESRYPQNMPFISHYVSDSYFFASLSWLTPSTKEIQVKLPFYSFIVWFI